MGPRRSDRPHLVTMLRDSSDMLSSDMAWMASSSSMSRRFKRASAKKLVVPTGVLSKPASHQILGQFDNNPALYAVATEGYFAFYEATLNFATSSIWGVQLVVDFVVALAIATGWTVKDAREKGLPYLPYVAATFVLG